MKVKDTQGKVLEYARLMNQMREDLHYEETMTDDEFDKFDQTFCEIMALICYKYGHKIEYDQCGREDHKMCYTCLNSEQSIVLEGL